MKILMITDNLPPHLNANSSILYRVAEELRRTYGVKILVLGLRTAPGEVPLPYSEFQTFAIDGMYRYTNLVSAELKKFQKLLRIVSHPSIWPMAFRYFFLRHPLRGLYKKRIRGILKEIPDLDCVVAVSEPADIPLALTKLHLRLPWISYRLDPWRALSPGDVRRLRAEKELVERTCSAIVIPPTLRHEYLSEDTGRLPDKLRMVEFPNLRPLPEGGTQTAEWRKDLIHCAYVGQLYSGVRSPAFVMELFAAAREAGLVLHMIGNTEMDAAFWGDKLPENVILHGRVSYEEAAGYMQTADILVNLGNVIPDTLPSKIIDYFSSGKPILNFYRIERCPTLPYMERHPAALSIYEGEGFSEVLVRQVVDFCATHKGQRIPFAEMERLYPECTPAYVGGQVYETLRSVSGAEKRRPAP